MKRSSIVCAFLICTICMTLCAEEVQLKDGTKISGKLVGITGEKFQVKTNYGDIQVPRSEVVSITFPANQPKVEDESKANAESPAVVESLTGEEYTNSTAGFKLTVPKGWSSAPKMRSKDIVAALTSEDSTLFLLVTPEKFAGTLNTYKVLAQTQYQTSFSDFEMTSESEIQMDGRTGFRLVWHGKNKKANDAQVKALVYMLPYEGRMVRLSFLTLEPLFDVAVPTFEKIAASYRSLEGPK
ncbi:MAG TPA: hypothetical protein VN622_11280 [Clostridia bacterium]|nr:hypothetical protein [Clostridia bacterium]